MKPYYLPLLSALSLAVLGACGGGSSATGDNQTATGGMGGTGISQGPVTGFGSVYVNGVKYETESAQFVREGASSSDQTDFGLGEYVTVKGTINADGVTGTATEVYFEDYIEGPISAINVNTSSLVILGQTIDADRLTINLGFSVFDDLQVGNVVEISGIKDAAGHVLATAIRLKGSSSSASPNTEVKGTISMLDEGTKTFVLSGTGVEVDYFATLLDPAFAGVLKNGQTVEVKSTTPYDGVRLIASSIDLESSSTSFAENTEVELEGVVTRFASLTDFDVNGLTVNTGSNTEFENGTANISANVRVKVEGVVNASGILVASEVDVRESSASSELKATIDAIDVNARTITVLGKVMAINNYTILWKEVGEDDRTFTLSELSPGEYAEIRYNTLADGSLLASRVKIENDISGGNLGGEDTEVEGNVTAIDAAAQTFAISGITVTVEGTTRYEFDDQALTASEFFNSISVGMKLEVKGTLTGSNMMRATEAKIDD